MNVFTRQEAHYIASVAEALIMMCEDSIFSGWLGDADISAESILSLAELLYDRDVDVYEIFEYFEKYDSLDDVFSYNANEDEDDYNNFVVS
jgi:hypothetical protein